MSDLFSPEMLSFIAAALRSSTPVLLVVLGETLTQRVGVINLGVEGQMLVGAITGFAVTLASGSPTLGLLAGMFAATLLSAVHALLSLYFGANQIASGLAVLILGAGLSAFYGIPYVGEKISGFGSMAGVPLLGPLLGQLSVSVLIALLLTPLIGVWLYTTRTGLAWRAVGESTESARAMGINPLLIQWLGVLVGGLLSGLAGAALSVDYTSNWIENISSGRGLVAVGLVIVARWNPYLALPAALLYGGSEALYLRMQTWGVGVSPYLLSTLPYVIPLSVLVVTSGRLRQRGGGMPEGLKAVFKGS
ncbi:MAG: ABC transporter permease [Gammaproteobacteria bacterium]|nr:ABC transporter permease [Gammaproteobacteria bacterium]